MTKQLQSDLAELEKLKGIRIAMTNDQEPLFLGLSYQRKTPRVKALGWMFWTAVAIFFSVCALIMWVVVET